MLKNNSTIFKEQLKNISTVLNNSGNTTKLLTSFNSLDVAQQKVLLSSKLLTEEQKTQCLTMTTLSSANAKYTAEQIAKATGISTETLATWGLTEATDSLTMSQLAEMASSDAQAKKVLEKIVAQNAQAVANGEVTASNIALATSETGTTLATGAFTTAIKANIAAMKTWLLTTPAGWLTMLVGGIFLAVKAYKEFVSTAEKANEKIDESRSAYQETTSTIESMNSELEITKQKIEELEAKDALSFTDKEELDNLREQNNELERSITLQEKKQKNEATQTVADIKQNEDTLNDDFEKSIKNLSEYKKEYEEKKQIGLKGMHEGTVVLENYEATMAAMDKEMSRYEATVLDNIEKYEQYKEDIINKYGTDDISVFSQSDRSLYENIVTKLQSAYKEIYTDSEYNKFVIEPIFNEEKLKGLQDELLKYFISGGQTDLSSLEEKFGSDIITALRNACIRAGIDFDKMIGDIYNNSQSKLDQIAPIVDVPSGAYDAKQNSISKQIRDYIQNGLSEEDRTILLNAEIPDDVKFKTKKDVDDFIASLKTDTSNETDILSISDTVDQINTQLKPSLDSLKNAYQDIFTIDSDTSEKLFSLDNVGIDTFDSIKSSLDKLNEIDGINVDYSSFENFVSVLSDSSSTAEEVQAQFDNLATSIIFTTDCTNMSADTYNLLVTSLRNLGITNAEDVLSNLKDIQEELIDAGYNLADITVEEATELLSLGKVSLETAEYLRLYLVQKELAKNPLNTSADILALESLCNSLGITGKLYEYVIDLKEAFNAKESGAVSAGLDESIANIKNKIAELSRGEGGYTFSFDDIDTSTKTPSGSSSDKWLQEYKDAMSILKDQLDQGLITQTQFYKKSQELMDKYLKDTPAHVKKYAKEISEAEKDIRNGLTSMFEGIISDINSDLDNMQSSFSSIADAIEEYNESGALSIDTVQELLKLEPKYLSMLFDENGALQLNQESYERLARAKMEEMKIGLAMDMANTINNLETEAQAIEFVTQMNKELINSNLAVAESYLQMAVAAAKARSERTGNAIFSQAADIGLQAYQNQVSLIDMTSYDFSSLSGSSLKSKKDDEYDKLVKNLEHKYKMEEVNTKEYHEKLLELARNYYGEESDQYKSAEEDLYNYLKDFEPTNWVERRIDKVAKKVEKAVQNVERYYTWQRKNAEINKSIGVINESIIGYQKAYRTYMRRADSIELSPEYRKKVENGEFTFEDIHDEKLKRHIDQYEEWYDKAQDVEDQLNDLYDQERELIKQKLDNILSYYDSIDSYLTSITSKVESLISLNDEMGKRSSLTDLVEQFSNLTNQMNVIDSNGQFEDVITKQLASGTAESVKKAIKDANAEEAERLKQEISNLDVTESGTYDKLLKNIAKTESEIAKYEEKGWDVKKEKKYNKLQKKLENYYALQEALDNNATSNTISNYSKVFNEWQKLMDNTRYQKLLDKESEGTLTKSDQKLLDKYNKKLATYEEKMEKIKNQGQEELDALANQLSIVNGTTKVTDADKIREKIASIEEELQNTATYSSLMKKIEDTEAKIAELDAIGYDNLTKKQKSTYDKMLDTLEDYYDRKAALDEGATSENVNSYDKIYVAWKKLQDRLDIGKNLSTDEWKKYNSYLQKLEKWANEKAEQYKSLNAQLETALNPPDKQTAINTEYEDSSEQIYESYQNQIDAIKNGYKNTQTYQDILAKKQKLEKKKDTKGLSKDEERILNKYNDKLQAFADGATFANITEYMKVWDELYKLQSKLDSGKSLTSDQRKKYDEYTAKLKQWNEEKQSQIDDLTSQMQEELDALNQTYTENVAQAETDMSEYYANLYSLAKQIAEYNITSLEQQLSVIESMVSYYENLVGLYETFSGDKLSSLLVDLEEDAAITKLEIYQKQLESLNQQYDVTKSKFKEYQQLLDALDTDNFESSLELFNTILKDDSISQSTKDNLQKVIDLLNKRAMDANDWGEYADQWENEWRQALTEAKQDLISIAGSIQEVNDAIRETSLEPLTDAITQLGYLKDTLSSITSLINDDWIFDDEGNLTEYGNAKVSLLVEQMQNARNEADKYAQQIDAIMSMRDTYSSEDAYQTALQEAKQNYLNSLNELKGFEDSVVSIMTQSNEAIVESLKDVISARINALKAQKELYEYGKNIANSQKEVDNIKAQIDALENLSDATDAATKAKLAQLKADLEEKETALQETKDNHTYNLQIDALDEFMNTLDETMSNAADAVNKSFETYKEAIDSALKVYEENKDYLGEWSDTIMKNILGFANADGANTINVNVQQSESGENIKKPQLFAPIENGTTSTGTIDGDLIDIKTAIEQGLIVKVDSPLTTINPEMMNFMKGYIPPMANTVCTTLPQIAERKDTQNVINVHYDNLLNVEGNVDKDFAKVLPNYLEESYQYMTTRLYNEINKVK